MPTRTPPAEKTARTAARGSTGLTPKQERFVAEYLVDLNGTQAAIRAGYSAKTAGQQAEQLLKKLEISAAVTAGRAAQVDKLDIDATRVLRELTRLATSDLRQLFKEDGSLRPIHELSDDVAAALASVEVVRRATGDDEPSEYLHKIKVWDKNTALTNLAKHLGLLVDRHEHTGKDGGPIKTEAGVDVSKLSTETLRRVLKETAG